MGLTDYTWILIGKRSFIHLNFSSEINATVLHRLYNRIDI